MVNQNHLEEPSIYALVHDGRFFYVGRTKLNAHNRWWEHRYRARINHPAPVYQKMRELGYEDVTYEILEFLTEDSNPKEREAWWIEELIGRGEPLVNAYGRDGIPDSWSQDQKSKGIPSRKGKATWIKGKTGIAAGWTPERRQAQAERMRNLNGQ